MEATGHLITSHLQIPADAVAHGDIQAVAEIPFSVLEELAEEVGAEKIPVHTLS
ncbi:TPA: pseudouridine synthase, partial [Corynebacterium striatum]|nr:pseudouridine synthase [Corynebacterium striatum]